MYKRTFSYESKMRPVRFQKNMNQSHHCNKYPQNLQSHLIQIDLYLKHGSDKTTREVNDIQAEENNFLSFWKRRHASYPVLVKVAARVFIVPAVCTAVDREFNFHGNIIILFLIVHSPINVDKKE